MEMDKVQHMRAHAPSPEMWINKHAVLALDFKNLVIFFSQASVFPFNIIKHISRPAWAGRGEVAGLASLNEWEGEKWVERRTG